MAPRAGIVALAVLLVAAGCTAPTTPRHHGGVPDGWADEPPERSQVATQTYFTLSESSTFLLKGVGYGRYIVHVPQAYEQAQLFFTSTNQGAPNATHPNVDAPVLHYELIQWRPLGKQIRVMDVSAGPAFNNASTGHSLTLAYLYGRGINYQYLVPYQGDPAHWRIDQGYYELVIASDENLTIGLNIKLGTPFWSTFYFPQELGDSRRAGLETYVAGWPGGTPRSLHQSRNVTVTANAGEILNYFCFGDLIYRDNLAAVGADGTVRVRIDQAEVPHRMSSTGVPPNGPQRSEAYAYAVSFNESGPVTHRLEATLDFSEAVSLESELAAQLLIFAVIVTPRSSLAGLPTREA